ncbi:MAG: SDR family oxidoreductase [Spirochaetia bacterium]|jgi:NAD(P)-dependent dehydrogenase (short-subunit alcohol dehydrogenase family)
MGKLVGKAALVTGGGSGFGEATAALWAREGAKVMVADISEAAARRVAESICKSGGRAEAFRVDVSRAEDAQKMIQAAVKAFGRLDILFNNAGILGPRSVYTSELPVAEAEKLLAVNVMGVFLGTRFAIPEMLKAGGGSIISTGSDSAFLGNRGLSMYCATKGAVLAFMRAVAMEYARQGIRANTVSPGAGKTPMHAELIDGNREAWRQVEEAIPVGRSCYPEDLARAALFFASDDSKYITGANLMVDGGWSVKGL